MNETVVPRHVPPSARMTTTYRSAKTATITAVTEVHRPMAEWILGKRSRLSSFISLLMAVYFSGPPPSNRNHDEREANARNPGSNLFVTGIHPRLSEGDVTRLFEKYGDVEGCSIMKDPHTQESRGFGFVKMVTAEQADAAKEGLQGENIEGRTLSIEKARRARPRTPTPGKYFGPPKRGETHPPLPLPGTSNSSY